MTSADSTPAPINPWEEGLTGLKVPSGQRSGARIDGTLKDLLVEFTTENGYNEGAMAKRVGVSVMTVRHAMALDPEFKSRLEAARMVFLSTLEKEAVRRAVKGVKQEKIGPGGVIYHTTVFSDALLMFLLKANAPEKYSDRVVVQRTDNVNVRIGLDQMPLAAKLKLLEVIEAATPQIIDAEAKVLPDATVQPSPSLPGMREAGGSEGGTLDPSNGSGPAVD